MWISEIAGPWEGNGADARFIAALAALLAPGDNGSDVTAQPCANLKPDPNCSIVRVRCEAETLDAIEADSRFLVLWCMEEVEEPEMAPALDTSTWEESARIIAEINSITIFTEEEWDAREPDGSIIIGGEPDDAI